MAVILARGGKWLIRYLDLFTSAYTFAFVCVCVCVYAIVVLRNVSQHLLKWYGRGQVSSESIEILEQYMS